jgi:hypothetical protein
VLLLWLTHTTGVRVTSFTTSSTKSRYAAGHETRWSNPMQMAGQVDACGLQANGKLIFAGKGLPEVIMDMACKQFDSEVIHKNGAYLCG